MPQLRVLFSLAGGPLKASSRVRGYWIAEALEKRGHEVTLTHVTNKLGYLALAKQILKNDVVVFQKAYSRYDPVLVKWARLCGKKTFFDIDDAPSRTSSPRVLRAAQKMMTTCHGVFAGSTALFDLASPYQPNVHLVASGIRLASYSPQSRAEKPQKPCLGWIGNGAHYSQDLVSILAPVLEKIAAEKELRFRLVGACEDKNLHDVFSNIPGLEAELIDTIDWADPEAVNHQISQFDIGLYPLQPGPFNDFKCGFKALEYMAMRLPVVASDAANHSEIVQDGQTGFIAQSETDWGGSLRALINDAELRVRMGSAGRNLVEQEFDTNTLARNIEECMLAAM